MGCSCSYDRYSYKHDNGCNVMANTLQDLLDNQVELSWTPPQNFYFVINRIPELMFTAQRIQVPVINAEEINQPSKLNPSRTMIPGSGLDHSVLSCDFIIDKDFVTYKTILTWMKQNYATEDKSLQWKDWFSTMSNVDVFGTDAANTPLVRWTFVDAFPISLDGPMYDATMPDIEYLTSNVTLRFKYFTFTSYTNGIENDDTV